MRLVTAKTFRGVPRRDAVPPVPLRFAEPVVGELVACVLPPHAARARAVAAANATARKERVTIISPLLARSAHADLGLLAILMDTDWSVQAISASIFDDRS